MTNQRPASSLSAASLHSTPPVSMSRTAVSSGGSGGSKLPAGAYPAPLTSIVRPPTNTRRAVISPLVSVPVLSEQITVVHPSVSTAGMRRTSALRFAISCIPTASAPVTIAASASGTAATASAMANMVMVNTSSDVELIAHPRPARC